MRIAKATARNFKSFSDFSHEFGEVNIFSGRNAAGKSSVLDILCAAFVSDGDRDLLKSGAEDGEIVVVLQEGTETIEIRRTLKPGKVSPPVVKSSRDGRKGAAAQFLESIVDAATIDPIRKVMTAPEKEQIRILLETLPLEMEAASIAEAVDGLLAPGALKLVKGKANLDTITAAHAELYRQRTDINRDAKLKRASAEELRASVASWAAPEGTSWQDEVDRIDAELAKVKSADEAKRIAAEGVRSAAVLAAHQYRNGQDSSIDAEIDAEIKLLEEERAKRRRNAADDYSQSVAEAEADHRLTLDGINGGSAETRDRLVAEKTAAQQRARDEAQVSRTLEIAAKATVEADAAQQKADRLTAALKALGIAKDQLLERLPIKGLVVANGTATLNGVPLQELNTAEKAKFWIRVAVLRAINRDLAVVVLDDAEHFDDENWPLLLKACKESGIQFFISRVEPHDFEVTVL